MLRLLCALVAVFAVPAGAHDFWVMPSRFSTADSAWVHLTIHTGDKLKGNSEPFIQDWTVDFSYTDNEGRRPIRSRMGDDPAARIELSPGTSLIGFHSKRFKVAFGGGKFRDYLVAEGLEHMLPALDASADPNGQQPEYFVRCAKTLAHRPGPAGEAYRTQLGYPLELLPEADPYTLSRGAALPVQLLYLGSPLAGARVRAYSQAEPERHVDVRTDAAGRAELRLPGPGVWLLKAVHLTELVGNPNARWESFWATLLFELP